MTPGALTPTLYDQMVHVGVWMPYRVAARMLHRLTRVQVSEATARRATIRQGKAVVAAQTAEATRILATHPKPPSGPALLQLSVDGVFVQQVGGVWVEVKTLAVGEIVPIVQRDGTPGVRGEAMSYFARWEPADTFTELATAECHRRGVETAARVVAVQDGAEWEQGFVDTHRPDAVRVLDFYHAVEHLTAAANGSLGVGTPASQAWVSARATELHHGDPAVVLASVRALPVEAATQPAAATTARDQTMAYLTKRWDQIAYARFQAQGLPIGSGAIESANKLVVEARLKGAGMRWAPDHLNPLLALRTVACNDRWDEEAAARVRGVRADARDRSTARRQHRQAAARQPAPRAPAPLANFTLTEECRGEELPHQPASSPALRPNLIVNGRPTAAHPWRRPLNPPRLPQPPLLTKL